MEVARKVQSGEIGADVAEVLEVARLARVEGLGASRLRLALPRLLTLM